MNLAYKRVKANRGIGGIDGIDVDELLTFLRENREHIIQQIKNGKYCPNPVRRVEMSKEDNGKLRQLGIPTVGDRVILKKR